MAKTLRIATDVGGTFTDLVAFATDEAGRSTVRIAKSDTTPPNFEQGVLNVMDKAGIKVAEVDFLAHGTTVVINALTERKGVKVGLTTTRGFRDTLEIARGNRPDFFNLSYEKPKPFVPRYLRRELPERMTCRGEVHTSLDLTGLAAIVADFKADGVQPTTVRYLRRLDAALKGQGLKNRPTSCNQTAAWTASNRSRAPRSPWLKAGLPRGSGGPPNLAS